MVTLALEVYGDGPGTVAKLLEPESRFVLLPPPSVIRRWLSGIPAFRPSCFLSVLSLATVSQLETAQRLPLKSTAAATLRDWFRQDFESAWEKLLKENARKQGVLPLEPEGGELPLDESR